MTRLTTRLTVLSVLASLLPGCAAPLPQKNPDPRVDQLLVRMDQCLDHQVTSSMQLYQQQQQLLRQEQQLQTLTEKLQTPPTAKADGDSSRAAVVNCPQPDEDSRKLLVGELEQVWLPNLELALPARIDTGAETASLDARNIELFERDGSRWVRFEILHPESGEPQVLERKLKRMVKIVQANDKESERRPVIRLGITIGHIHQTAEFSLSNRSHLDSQMLIGRNILQDVMVVDVGKKNIAPYVLYGDGDKP